MDAVSEPVEMRSAVHLLSGLTEPAFLVSRDGRLTWRNTAFDDRFATDPTTADALCGLVASLHGPEAPTAAHLPDESGFACRVTRVDPVRLGARPLAPAQAAPPRPEASEPSDGRPEARHPEPTASCSSVPAPDPGAPPAAAARAPMPEPRLELLHWPLRDPSGTARGCAVILRDPTTDALLYALRAELLEIANDLAAGPGQRVEAILAAACRHCGAVGAELIETGKGRAPIRHGIRPEDGAAGDPRSVPVRIGPEQVGTLRLIDPASLAANDADAQHSQPDRALPLCAASLAREIAQQRREAALREEAWRDWLTGAATRRAFDSALQEAVRAPFGSGPGNSLLIFDIDRFKTVNDTGGHALGDRVLRTVAQMVKQMLPETLPLYRIGGEEFALILPQTGTRAACALAETLRERIAGLTLPHGLRITASFGVARTARHADDAAHLYARADHALYAAKRAGRNRIKRAATPGARVPTVPTPTGAGDLMQVKARPRHH